MKQKTMKLATAQINPKKEDINYNLNEHYRFIELASQQRADLIVFPEMSITGYELEDAKEFSLTVNDSRLNLLKQLAIEKQMTIIVGAPIRIDNHLYIGSFVMRPDNNTLLYTKQFLHSGEDRYFTPSTEYNPLIKIGNERINLAICADIENSNHIKNANTKGCTIYIPSIFYTPNGISSVHKKLADYAKKYSIDILMSNFCGDSWEYKAAGQCGFWNNKGELIGSLNNITPGLLIVEKDDDDWYEIAKYK